MINTDSQNCSTVTYRFRVSFWRLARVTQAVSGTLNATLCKTDHRGLPSLGCQAALPHTNDVYTRYLI